MKQQTTEEEARLQYAVRLQIGISIRDLMYDKFIGIRDLSKMIGISRSTVSQITHGRVENLSINVLVSIARALEVSLYRIMPDSSNINPEQIEPYIKSVEIEPKKINPEHSDEMLSFLSNPPKRVPRTTTIATTTATPNLTEETPPNKPLPMSIDELVRRGKKLKENEAAERTQSSHREPANINILEFPPQEEEPTSESGNESIIEEEPNIIPNLLTDEDARLKLLEELRQKPRMHVQEGPVSTLYGKDNEVIEEVY